MSIYPNPCPDVIKLIPVVSGLGEDVNRSSPVVLTRGGD
jgi:hypothetical protein